MGRLIAFILSMNLALVLVGSSSTVSTKPCTGPIVPYLIPAEWVEQARRIPTNTGPTAA